MKANDAELAGLLSQAERAGKCLVPSCDRVRAILRRRAECGAVVRPMRGVYASSACWNGLSRFDQALYVLRTVQELHPDWVFCHESAAVAFGLSVSYSSLDVVHVATSRSRRNLSSTNVRWHVISGDEPVVVRGLRVTSLSRTVFDCMRTSGFEQALAVADSALRMSGKPSSWFVSRFKRLGSGHAHVADAVRTMYHADPLSESGGESIARAVMIRQGFALPELQVALPQPLHAGRFYRVDFLWTRLDGGRVLGEFDGMQKYEDAELLGGRSSLRALADERHREAQITLYGMPIVRFSYKDVMDQALFVKLLERYGVPRSTETTLAERKFERSRSDSAQVFTVRSFEDGPFEPFGA